MSELTTKIESVLRGQFLRTATYSGTGGSAWFVGIDRDAASIAGFFCGDDVHPVNTGRIWRRRVPSRIEKFAESDGISILRPSEPDPNLDLASGAIAVPELVDIHTDLPGDLDVLHAQLLTSTTKEDFRRMRKANFSYRVTSDPGEVREFHTRHYAPLVRQQFPEDGRVKPLARMVGTIDQGGELVCADIDGEWVAGIFNIVHENSYSLMSLGIRDASEAVRHKRVVAALIVRSLERGVELGLAKATLGRSLPFLGKGPVWFKAKWNGTLSCKPGTRDMYMFLDLGQSSVRRMLAASPIIHRDGEALAVSAWLEPGEKPLQDMMREVGRFPGITRWYVIAEPETIVEATEKLDSVDKVVPVSVTGRSNNPMWLGELLSGAEVSARADSTSGGNPTSYETSSEGG